MRSYVRLMVLFASSLGCACAGDSLARAEEGLVRQLATVTRLPDYPVRSIANQSTGVAVASIRIDSKGHVGEVSVLQAPDPDISQAVVASVKQWRFKPDPKGATVLGKLTFYYVIRGREARVLNPSEMASAIQ